VGKIGYTKMDGVIRMGNQITTVARGILNISIAKLWLKMQNPFGDELF